MIIIFAVILSIISITLSYRLKIDYEPVLLIKIIGYYILSVTTISLNSIYPIPIGFIISYVLADNALHNKKAKRICTLLGLLNCTICVILYFIFIT